jgi:hypothetical protein
MGMSRLLKSRDYLIKCLGLVLILGFISLGAIGGCSDNNGGQATTGATTALTENDFGTDPGLVADPERHLIVTFLEHPDSEGHENDTGEAGHDIIPHTYKRTLEHTFCWEDDDLEAGHFMELDDSGGNEILRLDVNGECVTEIIEAGDYVMTIWHDGRIERNHPIFIIHGHDGDLGARKEETIPEGILERGVRFLSNILESLDVSIAQTTNAQTVEDNIRTLIIRRSCISCNLTDANLTKAVLTGANLTGANLSGATLTGATLTGVIWCGAKRDLYKDNCDGTITDKDTNLMWEKKTASNFSDQYTWFESLDYINQLNADKFAGHDDWRLPEAGRDGGKPVLETLLLQPFPCKTIVGLLGSSSTPPCIDPIFGPTVGDFHWSNTTLGANPDGAWLVSFNNGEFLNNSKDFPFGLARAVRDVQ